MRASLVELLIPSRCPACDARRPEGALLLCISCASRVKRLERLGEVATVFAYESVVLEMVRRFKFDGRRDGLRALVPALAARARQLPVDVVVPVPRHRARVRALGSDPAHELGRALARALGAPLRSGVLRRTRRTPPQTELDARLRRSAPRGSFAARSGALAGLRVLLLDDVTTTGATLRAARSALAEADPADVYPLALAGTEARQAEA